MDEIQELSWFSIADVQVPILGILAANDRIVDNSKVKQFLTPIMDGSSRNYWKTLESGHSIQFEKAKEVSELIIQFIKKS